MNYSNKRKSFLCQINCAGGTRLGNIEKCDMEDLDWNFRLNVRAPFMLTKAVTPHLEKTKGTNTLDVFGSFAIHANEPM